MVSVLYNGNGKLYRLPCHEEITFKHSKIYKPLDKIWTFPEDPEVEEEIFVAYEDLELVPS